MACHASTGDFIEQNQLQCGFCRAVLIAEELDIHVCRKNVLDFKIENNVLWIYDGKSWFQHKLLSPTDSQERFKTTDEPTKL